MNKESALLQLYDQVQMNKTTSKEYSILQHKCKEFREKFEENLSDEQRKDLEKLLVLRNDRDEQEAKEYFIEGFKMATRIMTETFYNSKN